MKAAEVLVSKGDDHLARLGHHSFSNLACELLSSAGLPHLYDFNQLMKDTFKSGSTFEQNYRGFEFSDMPLTLARGERCFIDLYFWRRRPTVIHNHHFTGAFQCLLGQNVDLDFEFHVKEKVGIHHQVGELILKQQRILRSGDISSIGLLDEYIHQNHHQADLTVNLCFRTPDIGDTHLSNYLYSGLKFEKHPRLIHRVALLEAAVHMGEMDFESFDLTLDDALFFLLCHYGTESRSKKFLSLRDFLHQKILNETTLDLKKMFDIHALKMEQIESEYE